MQWFNARKNRGSGGRTSTKNASNWVKGHVTLRRHPGSMTMSERGRRDDKHAEQSAVDSRIAPSRLRWRNKSRQSLLLWFCASSRSLSHQFVEEWRKKNKMKPLMFSLVKLWESLMAINASVSIVIYVSCVGSLYLLIYIYISHFLRPLKQLPPGAYSSAKFSSVVLLCWSVTF